MKYTADCPSCSSEFEIGGPTAAQIGLECPTCHHKFQPESIHRTKLPEEISPEHVSTRTVRPQYLNMEAARLAQVGSWFNIGAGIFATLSIIIAFGTLLEKLNDGEAGDLLYAIPGLLILAAVLFFFGQAFHIRATLEKIANK